MREETEQGSSTRLTSLDFVRGAVMVLMALDHVRVYSGVPAGGPTAALFFTRWVTHFCAPAFVFLAGTGAFLRGRATGDRAALARFLVARGALLVCLELTVIRFGWTFNLDYSHFMLAGVIWMIGWSMIVLAALVRLTPRTIAAIGLAVIVCQPVFHVVPSVVPASIRPAVGRIWEFIYPAGFDSWPGIYVLYVLVPWIGVMAAGYGFGAIVTRNAADRRRLCLRIGLSATALFAAYAVVGVLGHSADDEMPALFRALSPSKYPASPAFLLMTLGPTIALLPLVEHVRGRLATMLLTFGRVPLFYYVLHIPLIHAAALFVTMAREGRAHPEWYARAPFAAVPAGHQWGLGLVYLVLVAVVGVLYVACRWFARLKTRRPHGWLPYL